jgi:hypothetical protein
MGLIHKKIKTRFVFVLAVTQGGDAQGVITTRGGAIFVNEATLFPDKGTGILVVVQQFQGDHRQVGFLQQLGFGIKAQELLG